MGDDPPARALHDRVVCLVPGLFTSLARTRRAPASGDAGGAGHLPAARARRTIVYPHGAVRYVFEVPEALGCDDMRVLQGVVALANRSLPLVTPFGEDAGHRRLRQDLRLTGAPLGEDAVLVECSLADLCRAAGNAGDGGGGMRASLRASLRRLSGVQVRVEEHGRDAGWRLLAYDMDGGGQRRARVALNPRTGACAQGRAQFTLLDLDGARRLGDAARLLHQRLSAWIDDSERPGKAGAQRRVGMDRLLGYVWDTTPTPNADALRQRRATVRRALGELVGIGWSIGEVPGTRGMYEIRRRDPRARADPASPGDGATSVDGVPD